MSTDAQPGAKDAQGVHANTAGGPDALGHTPSNLQNTPIHFRLCYGPSSPTGAAIKGSVQPPLAPASRVRTHPRVTPLTPPPCPADCDCAQCNGDLWLSAVVSPAAPGVAVCPEHAEVGPAGTALAWHVAGATGPSLRQRQPLVFAGPPRRDARRHALSAHSHRRCIPALSCRRLCAGTVARGTAWCCCTVIRLRSWMTWWRSRWSASRVLPRRWRRRASDAGASRRRACGRGQWVRAGLPCGAAHRAAAARGT